MESTRRPAGRGHAGLGPAGGNKATASRQGSHHGELVHRETQEYRKRARGPGGCKLLGGEAKERRGSLREAGRGEPRRKWCQREARARRAREQETPKGERQRLALRAVIVKGYRKGPERGEMARERQGETSPRESGARGRQGRDEPEKRRPGRGDSRG